VYNQGFTIRRRKLSNLITYIKTTLPNSSKPQNQHIPIENLRESEKVKGENTGLRRGDRAVTFEGERKYVDHPIKSNCIGTVKASREKPSSRVEDHG
jgi:hypothetical protein